MAEAKTTERERPIRREDILEDGERVRKEEMECYATEALSAMMASVTREKVRSKLIASRGEGCRIRVDFCEREGYTTREILIQALPRTSRYLYTLVDKECFRCVVECETNQFTVVINPVREEHGDVTCLFLLNRFWRDLTADYQRV
jgi:hypothetical protein